jgi:hypothetical protein
MHISRYIRKVFHLKDLGDTILALIKSFLSTISNFNYTPMAVMKPSQDLIDMFCECNSKTWGQSEKLIFEVPTKTFLPSNSYFALQI